MSNIPAELRYSEDHEWISTSAPWKIGVSDYAQNALGDLTYVELPSVGDTFEKGQEFGTLESTKSVSPLFMPVAGTIKAVNEALVDAPEKVNQDPYGEGWLIEIESAEGVSELLDGDTMPFILYKHIYAMAAFAGALVCVLLIHIHLYLALAAGTAVVIVIRVLATHYCWDLPRPLHEKDAHTKTKNLSENSNADDT